MIVPWKFNSTIQNYEIIYFKLWDKEHCGLPKSFFPSDTNLCWRLSTMELRPDTHIDLAFKCSQHQITKTMNECSWNIKHGRMKDNGWTNPHKLNWIVQERKKSITAHLYSKLLRSLKQFNPPFCKKGGCRHYMPSCGLDYPLLNAFNEHASLSPNYVNYFKWKWENKEQSYWESPVLSPGQRAGTSNCHELPMMLMSDHLRSSGVHFHGYSRPFVRRHIPT